MVVLIVLLGMAVLLLGVLVAGLLRSHADVLRALHELGVGDDGAAPAAPRPPGLERTGTTARDVIGRSPADTQVAITVEGGTHSTLLAFLTSGCTTCQGFWEAFTEPQVVLPPGADRLVIVTKGPANESPAAIAAIAPSAIQVVMSDEAWDDYDVPVAPYFVLVDSGGGIVGEGAALSWSQVAGLLSKAAADAGLGSRPQPSARTDDADRGERVETDLRAAGIAPGHPSLYPDEQSPVEGGEMNAAEVAVTVGVVAAVVGAIRSTWSP